MMIKYRLHEAAKDFEKDNKTLIDILKKYTGETTIISMRLAKDLVKDIDAVANVTGRNRNEILTMSLEFALNHMEIVMKERENNGSY